MQLCDMMRYTCVTLSLSSPTRLVWLRGRKKKTSWFVFDKLSGAGKRKRGCFPLKKKRGRGGVDYWKRKRGLERERLVSWWIGWCHPFTWFVLLEMEDLELVECCLLHFPASSLCFCLYFSLSLCFSPSVSLSPSLSLSISRSPSRSLLFSLSLSLCLSLSFSLSLSLFLSCPALPFALSYPDGVCSYGVSTISRLLQITGLFFKRALLKRRYSAKETYNFKEPTNRSHPIQRGCIAARFWSYSLIRISHIVHMNAYE